MKLRQIMLNGAGPECYKSEKLEKINEKPKTWIFSHWNRELDERGRLVAHFIDRAQYVKNIPCPYGKPGDVLEVRGSDIKAQITEIRVELLDVWKWVIRYNLLT